MREKHEKIVARMVYMEPAHVNYRLGECGDGRHYEEKSNEQTR